MAMATAGMAMGTATVTRTTDTVRMEATATAITDTMDPSDILDGVERARLTTTGSTISVSRPT